MLMKTRIILVACAIVSASVSAAAQGGADALPFTRMETSPVLAGTAGAAVTALQGAWGAFRGAATGAFETETVSAAAQYTNFGGHSAFAAAAGVGVGGNIFLSAGVTGSDGENGGGYQTGNALAAFGAGVRLGESLSVGANLRFASQYLTADAKYSGASADVSLLYKVSETISAAAGVCTLGSSVKSSSGDAYAQPAYAFAGWTGTVGLGDIVIDVHFAADYYFSGEYAAAAGAVLTYAGNCYLFLRRLKKKGARRLPDS